MESRLHTFCFFCWHARHAIRARLAWARTDMFGADEAIAAPVQRNVHSPSEKLLLMIFSSIWSKNAMRPHVRSARMKIGSIKFSVSCLWRM
jgi:hypothetical protein